MSTDEVFPGLPTENTRALVARLKKWQESPNSEPEIETWYNEVYLPSRGKGTAFDTRSLPRMPWELEWDIYSVMYDAARDLERQARPEEALDTYNAILLAFVPRGMAYYERPAILLERMRHYDEAIAICDRAIEVIEARLFHANAEPFRKRKARLMAKEKRRES